MEIFILMLDEDLCDGWWSFSNENLSLCISLIFPSLGGNEKSIWLEVLATERGRRCIQVKGDGANLFW